MMESSNRHEAASDMLSVQSPANIFEQPVSASTGVVAQGEITVPGTGVLEATPAVAQSDSIAAPGSWLETVVQTDVTEMPTTTDTPHEQASVEPANEAWWQIDQSMADSLVAELSVATPEVQHEIAQTVSRVKAIYENDYGAFIQPEYIKAAADAEQRIVVVEPDIFNVFCNNWEQNNNEIPPSIYAGFTPLGNVIVFKDPAIHWDAFSTAVQQKMVAIFGSVEEAKALVCKTALDYTATHELAHQYEANDTPVAFSELGACYYQKAVTMRDGRRYVPFADVDKRAAFYKSLLDTYGDDVHRVFFGTLDNPERRAQILSHLTPENIKKLYLNGDGWGHEQPKEETRHQAPRS